MIASFFGGMHDFFHSTAFRIAWGTSAAVIGLFWIATIAWVRKDARRRIASTPLVWLATLIGAIPPFIGPLIYMLFRPPEYLEDVRERELEMQAAEARLHSLNYFLCPHCDTEVERDFLRCPSCMRKLKDSCYSCGKPIDPAWKLCPYCEAETGASTPSSSRRRRRRETTDQPTVAHEAPPN